MKKPRLDRADKSFITWVITQKLSICVSTDMSWIRYSDNVLSVRVSRRYPVTFSEWHGIGKYIKLPGLIVALENIP